jgi:predicted transposase/invertase (TIGR01784 family)
MSDKHIRFDWAIKKLLRHKSNFVILEGFLSELLKEDILIQEILESESNKQTLEDKSNRVDILVKNSKGQLLLIEVQNEKSHNYFHRMNYGQAKLISEHIFIGDDYDTVKKVYSINIVYFDLGQGTDYVYIGETKFTGMHNQDDLKLSETQKQLYTAQHPKDIFATYYILKVNNFNNIAKDTLDEWIYFLKNSEIPNNFQAKGLKEARERMRVDNLENNEKIAYQQYIKYERIRKGEIDSAIYDAKQEVKNEIMLLIKEERRQKEEERRQKEEERRQKEEAEAREEEERTQKEEERRQKEDVKAKLVLSVKKFYEMGVTKESIGEMFGIEISEVEKMLLQ